MPLDEREEALFRSIEAELRAEDPEFAARLSGVSRWRPLLATAFWPVAALTVGLLVLPLSAEFGLYPVGLVGYVLATFAAVTIARRRSQHGIRLPWRARSEADPRSSHPEAESLPGDRRVAEDGSEQTNAARPWGRQGRDPRPMVFGAAIAVVAMVTMAFLPGAPTHRVAEATPSETSTTAEVGDAAPGAGESTTEFRACRPPYRDCTAEEPSAADLP